DPGRTHSLAAKDAGELRPQSHQTVTPRQSPEAEAPNLGEANACARGGAKETCSRWVAASVRVAPAVHEKALGPWGGPRAGLVCHWRSGPKASGGEDFQRLRSPTTQSREQRSVMGVVSTSRGFCDVSVPSRRGPHQARGPAGPALPVPRPRRARPPHSRDSVRARRGRGVERTPRSPPPCAEIPPPSNPFRQ